MTNVNPPVPTSQENKDKLSDTRRHRFFIIDNEILENKAITKTDFMVYSVIIYHAGMKDYCWPGIATIAEESRCGHNQVRDSIKHLETLGYIGRTERTGATNIYKVLSVEKQPLPNQGGVPLPNQVDEQDTIQQDVRYVRIEPTKKDTFLYENREGYTDKEIQAAVMVYDEYTKPVGNPSGFIEAVLKKTRDMETITPPEQHKPIIHHSMPQAEIDKERDETRQGMLINMDKVKQAAGIEN